MIVINQQKKIEEKLRIYGKPFIDFDLLKTIIEKFAPNYKIFQFSSRNLISPIKQGKIYFNHLSNKSSSIIGTTILSQYFQGEKYYAVGGIYVYNMYGYTTQIANKITVYNLRISGEKVIAGYQFIFKKERENFFYGIEEKDAQGYGRYNCFSHERALIQLIKEKKGKLEFAEDIYELIEKGEINIDKLQDLTIKHTSRQTQILLQEFLKEGKILAK